MDRDEIIAELIASYKQELAMLTDDELHQHWKLQKGVADMTEKEWAVIYQRQGK